MTRGDHLLSAPERLRADLDLSRFECGEPSLDEWLKRRALQNEKTGASRTYVICTSEEVVGYYALAVGAVASEKAPGRVRRNMADPIPVMILGRLAVHKDFQGKKVGQGLLRDAVLRTLQASNIAGIRAILVHAISERAVKFYEESGFAPSPMDPLTLVISVSEAVAALGGKAIP